MTTPEQTLRRVVMAVAALNLAACVVEVLVALSTGAVTLMADSADFVEDAAINLLIAMALGWSLAARARAGKVMACIVLLPAAAAGWQAISKGLDGAPSAPEWRLVALTAGLAAVVNGVCAWLLARHRHAGGSLSRAAWLAARNDVVINIAIIGAALVTAVTASGWPDLVLGAAIVVINVGAAKEVWEIAESERLAARALAGEDLD